MECVCGCREAMEVSTSRRSDQPLRKQVSAPDQIVIFCVVSSCRLKGAVDRELGGNIYGCSPFFDFWQFCGEEQFLVRFLRIHPVQSVVNNTTQLSGRGFPCIFYMKLCLSQLYVFSVLQNGSRAVKTLHFENLNFENWKCWVFDSLQNIHFNNM